MQNELDYLAYCNIHANDDSHTLPCNVAVVEVYCYSSSLSNNKIGVRGITAVAEVLQDIPLKVLE